MSAKAIDQSWVRESHTSCPMCDEDVFSDEHGHIPRRCPSCGGWLAFRAFQPKNRGLREVSENDDQAPGWKKVSRASIFHRYQGPDEMYRVLVEPEEEVAPPAPLPKEPTQPEERRAISFRFEAPERTDRFRKKREVEAEVLAREVHPREHADLDVDEAIDSWLDLASEILEEQGVDEITPSSQDVEFQVTELDLDLMSERMDDDLATIDESRSDVFSEQENSDVASSDVDDVEAETLLLFDTEDEAQDEDDISGHTLMMGSVSSPPRQAPPEVPVRKEQTLEDDDVDDGISETLMMFGAVSTTLEEPVSIVEDEPEHVDDLEDMPDVDPVDEIEDPVVVEPDAPVQDVEDLEPEVSSAQVVAPYRSVTQRGLLLGAVLCIFALGIAAGAFMMQSKEDRQIALSGTPGEFLESMVMLPRERASRNAVHSAKTLVGLSMSQPYMSHERQRQVAMDLIDSGEHGRALKVLGVVWADLQAREPALGVSYAQVAFEAREYSLARDVAVQTAILDEVTTTQLVSLGTVFNQAIKEDRTLHPPVRELKKDQDMDVIRALGGGKSISLKFKKDGKTTHAFKPSQLDWAEGWRAEVASYLFCEAIGCHFNVPVSEPVKISREDFEELYGRFQSTRQTTYAREFDARLLWVKELGADGQEREYLYGVLKDWVPGFVDFPIEYEEIWAPWLNASREDDWSKRDLSDVLRVLRFRQGGRFYNGVMSERQDATTLDVARGLSDIQVFDYLTSNWDRYSGVEMYYGVNNQFDDGEFLSLDNGAAFHVLTQQKVERHFEPVQRFSKSTIAAVRMLERDRVDDILFPDPSKEAQQRLDVFWLQRQKLLARVDSLIKEHGEQNVLYFR